GLRELPGSWVLYLQRGGVLAMRGLMSEAEKEFDTARRLAPDPAIPYAALGMVWIQSGQTERAVEVLRAELKRPKDYVVPYIFAVVLLLSGVDPAALAAAEAVQALRASCPGPSRARRQAEREGTRRRSGPRAAPGVRTHREGRPRAPPKARGRVMGAAVLWLLLAVPASSLERGIALLQKGDVTSAL